MPGKPELLAPAGSWEAMVAAVQNGADSVYLGGKSFSARQSAANFDEEELERVIRYAHVRGVRVYVTVNTLVAEDELEKAARFLFFLQNAGADAVILQDLGLASLAREVIPELPLHASTQMTVHNSPAAQLLLRTGWQRIILAREMSLEEIKALKRQTGAEVEVFIHGALCVCYSGQCLFSSLVGGRSGNRGRCAQPCRLPYALVDARGRALVDPEQTGEYLLSPRDLNLSGRLPDLVEAGIDAFKIEGRMKRPEYVAVVTRIYRKLIDRAYALGPGDFYVEPAEARELAQIFNRDFTTGYFYGRQGTEMMSYKRPNNRGVYLGRVKACERGYLLLALEDRLNVGDGLEVWVSRGGREGFEVKEILNRGRNVESAFPGQTVMVPYRGVAHVKDRVFKTRNRELIEQARATFASPKETRREPVAVSVRGKPGEPLVITVKDLENHTGEGKTRALGEAAHKQPLTADFLTRQLNRLGNTPFYMAGLECILEGEIIYPAGEINEARRQAISSLEEARARAFRKKPVLREVFDKRMSQTWFFGSPGARPRKNRPLLSVSVNDLASLKSAVDAGADAVYFGGDLFRSKPPPGREDFWKGFLYCREQGAKFILATPRIIKDGQLKAIYELIKDACQWPIDGVLTGNLGLLEKIREEIEVPLYADYAFNIFNARTCNFLRTLGVSQATLSPELTGAQVGQIVSRAKVATEIIVHGSLELMVSEYCAEGSLISGAPQKEKCARPCRKGGLYLKDRLGVLFPVEADQFCRMHIFNSRELCLLKHIPRLRETGVDSLRIDARRNVPAYTHSVTRAYRQAIDYGQQAIDYGQYEEALEDLQKITPVGVTTGHFFRGVD